MSETSNEDSGSGQSSGEENSNGQRSHSEALAMWRSSDKVQNGSPSTSPFYCDIDEFGSKHSELYGKHTWKIEKYSEINKCELRSDVFDVGGYKWCILIYPQGCDVCNHLSLFLCVANHETLLPGWSHLAQFTIALVNKDPKKSKYSDTLNRFWKKEHDWGWKNFIEIPKLQEGYIDDLDSLTIKAQVQMIRERVDRPFRCLSSLYRRELVRVYLPNVENICCRFMEEERIKFRRLMLDKEKWQSFSAYWLQLDQSTRRKMSRDKTDVVLNLASKLFLIEKEVTSTLVMDSLYSGWKAIESQTRNKKSRLSLVDNVKLPPGPAPIVCVDQDMFVLVDDLLLLIEKTVMGPLPIKAEKGSQNHSKVGNDGEEFSKEAIYESRLTEVGRRTIETLVLAHIYSNRIDFAHQQAIAWIRQDELIREEEEEGLADSKQKVKRGTTEKGRKSKKKQAKQKRNKNKGKEKRKEEKVRSQTEEMDIEKEESVRAKAELSAEKPDTLGDSSDVFASVDCPADVIQLDSEDRESSRVHCELDASEILHPSSGDPSRGRSSSISIPSGVAERKYTSTVNDNTSVCSNGSVRSGVANGSYKGNVLNWQSKNWRRKGRMQPRKVSDANSLATETEDQSSRHASYPKSQSHSSETRRIGEADVAISRIQEAQNPKEHNPVKKDRGRVQTQEKRPAIFSPPKASPWNLPYVAQAKPEKRGVFNVDTVPNRNAISARSSLSDQASPSRDIQFQTVGHRADVQNTTSPKTTAQPAPSMSRPLHAPTILLKQAEPVVSAARTSTTSFACAGSSTGRVSSRTHRQTYIPKSYKHSIVGSLSFDHSSSQLTGTSAMLSVSNQSGFPINVGSENISSGGLLWTGGSSSNRDTTTTISGNHRMNAYNTPENTSMRQNDVQISRPAQSLMTDEFPHLDIINDLLEEEHGLMDTSGYRAPQWLNNLYSFLADLGIYGRLRSYNDDGFYQSYSEYMPGSSSSSSTYGNGQMDGLTQPRQWQTANMDLSSLAMRSQNDAAAATYPYFDVGSSNPNLSARINGCRDFMPSNRN